METAQVLGDVLFGGSPTFIVIDAIDECSDTSIWQKLLETLRSLQSQADLRLLTTSRTVPEIMSYFAADPRLHVQADSNDVERYVAGQLHMLPRCIQ